MTPRTLRSKISKLDARAPITTTFEHDLRKLRTWGTNGVWYSTQKEHWLRWLKDYSGPGYYERKDWNRDAEFVYNHIVCPPMVLWLGEASGIPPSLVLKAKKAALAAPPSLPAKAAAIRNVISWSLIESRFAEAVIDSVLRGTSVNAKTCYLAFLTASVDSLLPEHCDRWGATLLEWGIRLNVGWVECLVLHPEGLNVLLCKESAPTGVKLNGFSYRWAPSCDMTTVPLPELAQRLPLLRDSHHEAISIAAGRPTNPTVRKGHSKGVALLLSEHLLRSGADR